MKNAHGVIAEVVWCCSVCDAQFDGKRQAAVHHRTHNLPADAMLDEDLPLGCRYCDKRFPSQRSLSQHERGAHQPQVSEREAEKARQAADTGQQRRRNGSWRV